MSKILRNYLLFFVVISAMVAGCNSGSTKTEVSATPEQDIQQQAEPEVSVEKSVSENASQPVAEEEVTEVVVESQVATAGESGVGILSVDKEEYDFGSIEPGGYQYGSFTLKNTGDGTLEILRLSAPCRCTIPELDKKVLAPGESVVLKFTFDVGTSYGKVVKTIDIATKSPAQPANMTLSFVADIRKVLEMTPEVLTFGLNDKYDNETEVTVSSSDGAEFHVAGYISTGEPVTVKYDPTVKARMHKITVTGNLENLRKAPIGTLTIKTDHPKVERITVRYDTKMPFDAFPKTKRFTPETESGRQAKIKVVSNFAEEFDLGEVVSRDGFIKVLDKKKSVDGYELTVELDMDKVEELAADKKVVSDYLVIPIVGHPEDTLEIHGYGLIK